MFTGKQFRAKAAESAESLKHTDVPSEIREFQRSKESFTALAENEDWLANNFDKIIRSRDIQDDGARKPVTRGSVAEAEEYILRCSARPSSCNGTRSQRSSSANSSIPQARWEMC
jgi:hypothetical protein